MIITDGDMGALEKLELIDAVQRLGLGYHFETEIRNALNHIGELGSNGGSCGFNDLYSTALLLRLFRQHGFHIEQGKSFLNQDGICVFLQPVMTVVLSR